MSVKRTILVYYVNVGSAEKEQVEGLLGEMKERVGLSQEELNSGGILKQLFVPCRVRETSVEVVNLLK